MTVSKIAPRKPSPPPPPPAPAKAATPKAAAPVKQAAAAPKDTFKPAPTPTPAAPAAAPRASPSTASAPVAARAPVASRTPTAPVGPSAPAALTAASSTPGAVPAAGATAQSGSQPQSQPRFAAGVQAQAQATTKPSFLGGIGQGLQDAFHGAVQGAQNAAHNVVQGTENVAHNVIQGTQNAAQGTAQALQQGVDNLGNAARGTGVFAPEPAAGFGTTAPGAAPLPAGARPVQDPQPTGVPGVTSDPDDGRIIGAGPTGPTSYPANTPINQVKPFTPEGQDPNAPRPTIYFTNGIANSSTDEAKSAQQLANQTGANVIAVHNGTNGGVVDVAQSGADRTGLPDGNAATRTLTNVLTQQAQTGQPVYVAAHSQGAIITSDALRNTENNLRSQGMSQDQINQTMGNFHVETFGGAAASYPSGPHYTHVIHPGDPVSGPLGMGNPLNAGPAALQGQHIVVASDPAPIYGNPFQNHTFSGYAPQAVLPP